MSCRLCYQKRRTRCVGSAYWRSSIASIRVVRAPFPAPLRSTSWSAHAPRCTWRSSRSDTSWPLWIDRGAASPARPRCGLRRGGDDHRRHELQAVRTAPHSPWQNRPAKTSATSSAGRHPPTAKALCGRVVTTLHSWRKSAGRVRLPRPAASRTRRRVVVCAASDLHVRGDPCHDRRRL